MYSQMHWTEIWKRLSHVFRNHRYRINGVVRSFRYLGYCDSSIEIWYENQEVKEFISSMPFSSRLFRIIKGYQWESGNTCKYVLIIDDKKTSDNWLYVDDKAWVITARAAVDLLLQTLSLAKVNTEEIKAFCFQHGMMQRKEVE